jgi:hypothetical protein
MKTLTTTRTLAVIAAFTLNLMSVGAAEPSATTNRPTLVPLRAKSYTLGGSWIWLKYNRKEPVGAAAEFPNVKYSHWAVQADAPNSILVTPLFKGATLRITGGRGPDHGLGDVIVDGKRVQTFDAYGPEQVCGEMLCEITGLDPNQDHEARVVSQRQPKSGGRRLIVEAIAAEAPSAFVNEYAAAGREEIARIAAGEKAYLKPEAWKPVAFAASAPQGGVTLDGGPLKECFDRNIAFLNGVFKGPEKKPGKSHGWGGWDGHLPGSGDGKMLGGAANSLRWGEREDLRAIVDYTVAMVKDRQRPDGYCMSFPEEHMGPSKDAWHDERRNYARVNWTRGMAAAAVAGNPDALPVMRKFYDWLETSTNQPGLLAGPYDGSSHNCNNGNDGHTLMYFSSLGKPEDLIAAQRYLVQDFHIEASRARNPYSLCNYPFHVPHSYVLLAYKFWLDMYRGTGDAKFLDGAQGAWDIVHDHYLNHGAITICEGDRSPPRMYWLKHKINTIEKYKGPHCPNETCGSVFWSDTNHRLLQFFPEETKYADAMESALFNVILAAQGTNGFIRYHNAHMGQKEKPISINHCCEVMAVPLIGALPQYLCSVAADGLYVNLYAPSTITTKTLTAKVTTEFPATGKVEIKVEGTGKLRLRIPGWVGADVPVNINGKVAATGKPGSYVTLDKPAGTVSFELPMELRITPYTGMDQHPEHDTYSLLYGPILLALVGADDLDIPAKDLPGKMKPVEGKPLHFTVAGKEGVRFQPYWQIQTETFTCFPTLR